jgi:hypothetical protein
MVMKSVSKSRYLFSGLAVAAALIGALPIANSLGAPTAVTPIFEVNRTSKGDRMPQPQLSVVKKKPVPEPRAPLLIEKRDEARKLMDGCDPMFSPVTSPAMAHLAGRCVG